MSQARKTLIRSLCSAIAAVVVALALLPVTALADGGGMPKMAKISKLKGTITIYCAGKGYNGYLDFSCKKGKLTKAKSSNPKVADVYPWSGDFKTSNAIYIAGYKKGKATITYTYKGKKHKVKVVVKKYSNPLKTLKIGKKNYERKLKKSVYDATVKWSACKGKKLSLTPAKGWKIASMKFTYTNADWSKYRTKKVRNGGKLPKVKYGDSLTVILKNTKNGAEQTVYFFFTR